MKHYSTAALLAAGAVVAVPRAVAAAPRADASNPAALIAQIQAGWEEFKGTIEANLGKKADDVVVNDKLDKINGSLVELEKALDEQATLIAANRLGGAPGDMEPTNPEYVAAFKAHMRRGDVSAAMSVGTAADGGYLAPVEWDRTVTNKLKLLSPIRANAQVISISGNGFSRVYNDGVIGSGWVGETAARPATATPGLTSLTFNTGELYANPAITQTALDDVAIDLEQWLSDEVDGEFSIQENIAFLSGNGVNKPDGILTYVTGAANAAKHPFGAIQLTTAAAAAAITTDEIIDLVYSLPSERNGMAKFYLNRSSLGRLRKLKDGQGNYIWQPTYVAGEPSTLAGYPVIEVPGMPNVATGLVPILFGDMAATYLVIDRIGIRVLRDPFTNKPFVHFYTTKRVGGGVQNPEYMRALKMA
ncbi:phage major capsid protein [Sphingomonas sanxanigenens]|uniref:Capsid protein n=1 Tax=Sphingomonas sanxanigenens DSM 19645 = NX02 TaxID=1123269 RepID=W0A3V1_9SPHN|nr:phage major capsid protein [Sphingomonas sanxanigenens]AHE51716.1 capsid protein [Sphingomonas sanxanigenens DSM 19645 = NX02]AHE51766.1 capsid protein [Sphingomonas sanxanigenens DSM 19645 = NX02]